MSNEMIVMAPEPADFIVTLEQFRAASTDWQPHARLAGPVSDTDPIDANIQVERPGEPLFQIFHYKNENMISTDGTEAQAAEVAAWVITTFPTTGDGEVWLTDTGYSGHTVLHPGISTADIRKNWQEHD